MDYKSTKAITKVPKVKSLKSLGLSSVWSSLFKPYRESGLAADNEVVQMLKSKSKCTVITEKYF